MIDFRSLREFIGEVWSWVTSRHLIECRACGTLHSGADPRYSRCSCGERLGDS